MKRKVIWQLVVPLLGLCVLFLLLAMEPTDVQTRQEPVEISVILREHPAFYQMTVEDNGTVGRKGQSGPLWEEEIVRMDGKEGIGLSNMKERVQALGGTFRIHTEKGFVIFISIPKRDKM